MSDVSTATRPTAQAIGVSNYSKIVRLMLWTVSQLWW